MDSSGYSLCDFLRRSLWLALRATHSLYMKQVVPSSATRQNCFGVRAGALMWWMGEDEREAQELVEVLVSLDPAILAAEVTGGSRVPWRCLFVTT